MRLKKKAIYFILSVGIIGFLTYLVIPMDPGSYRNYSQVILARDSSFLRVYLNQEEQWCLPPSLQEVIPDKLRIAVIEYEDQYFYYHPGINPVAIFRAAYLNIKRKKIVSGGSTISMQLARMRNNQERSFINKLKETFVAFKYEFHYSKDEILAEYLSHAPYGSNVRGYLAASHRFFGKKPHQLTWGEAATLAVLPNAPGLIFPSKNGKALKNKRDQLLLILKERKIIDNETYELSLLEQVPDEIIPFPLAAPHLTDHIHQENQIDIVRTTIDPNIQYETNFFVHQHANYLKQLGIQNVSALVINNKTSEVISYVGSQDYDDLENAGRVDGIRSNRSSGSILKPYLYALAIDEGLILPQTLIRDVPTYYNSFSPNNASEEFSGIVPAHEALVHSLNVPAVRLLNAYGVNKFYNMLKEAGVSSLFRNSDEYGLPLILGGAEVSPWDMAKLYSGMANGGKFGDITYLSKSNTSYQNQLISQVASYQILTELKELVRPGLEFYWKKYGSQKPIAWKTGTSYGHKDAWAVGVTPEWTIVVWAGNFTGQSNKSLSGMKSAGPLLFNLLNALPKKETTTWFEPDEVNTVKVKICKQTGFYAGIDCKNALMVDAPIGMKPLEICPYHRSTHIDHQGYAVCSHCWTHAKTRKSYLSYSPDVNYYLKKSGKVPETTPEHNPNCPTRQEHDVLQIIYPVGYSNIFVPKDFDGSHEPIVSRFATRHPDREIFWYLDDQLLGSTTHQTTWPLKLKAGEHRLMVQDEEGNKDQVEFSVTLN